jgi:transposase
VATAGICATLRRFGQILAWRDDTPFGQISGWLDADTGINLNSLYGWIRQYKNAQKKHTPFPGNGKVSSLEEELRQLRRRNKQLEEQIVILKKATAFFARETK